MADLRKKIWVQAHISDKFIGQELDPSNTTQLDPKHVNTYIVDWMDITDYRGHIDKAILNDFKEDFQGWTVDLFKMINQNIRKELKEFLKSRGIFVGSEDPRVFISDQLLKLLDSSVTESPEWPDDELELMKGMGKNFKSRRYNPNFDGQQDLVEQSLTFIPKKTEQQKTSKETGNSNNTEQSSDQNSSQQPPTSDTTGAVIPQQQAPQISKMLTDLHKLYHDNDLKFGGDFFDVLDAKLKIFYDLCNKAGITSSHYNAAYATMLKDKAQNFYYQHLSHQNLSFAQMISKTREYFHTAENYQLYLNEWRSTMLKDIITTHPEKDLSQCLEIVIDKLQKVHQGLIYNYNSSEGSLAGQLISACQGVEACASVLVRPSSTFEGVASDLRSAVGIWMRCHNSVPKAFHTMTLNDDNNDLHIDSDDQFYTDRRYVGIGRNRSNYGGKSSRGTYQRPNITRHKGSFTQQKKCFVCGKPGCWSTRHTPEERQKRHREWRSYLQEKNIDEDLETFLVNYEGIDIDDFSETDKDHHDGDFHTWLTSSRESVPSPDSQPFEQFHTACGNINGNVMTTLLNNRATMHALTRINPFLEEATEPQHLFHFRSRYDADMFQGIMPDTGAAGVSTAGEKQVLALQKKIPNITVDTSTAGQHKIRFGDNPENASLGTIGVTTPFGRIEFAVMPTNTPFLFCLADMDRHGVYLNNIKNVLVHEGKEFPIVRKWGHPWLLLEDLEASVAWCHLTETELRQLHRRFGHPAVERLYKVLLKAGFEDVKEEVITKINKYCHQCQMHGGAPGRFRFTLRDDIDFNYRLIIDVMYINSRPVLHAVDEATSFQAARFLPNMQAKTTWDTLRAMWIDTYVGPPDVIVTDAGTNLTATEFVENAHVMAIEIKEVPVEAHNSIGKVERYHAPIRRAYEVIMSDLGTAISPENALQMAVKAVNDTAGPNGLVPTLLVFGTYPRISNSSPPSPSITARAVALRKAMDEVRKLKAKRQVADALASRNGPNILDTIELPLQSEVKVWRENVGWTGPHTLLGRSNNDTTCIVDVNGKAVNFRTVVVKPYYRNESTIEPETIDVDNPSDGNDDDYWPDNEATQQPRKRGRPRGSKNKPQQQAIANVVDSSDTTFVSEREKADEALAIELRRNCKITTPGKAFEKSDQMEIESLIGRGVFRFEKYNPKKHNGVRIFKTRMVHEIKGKATNKPYEKSRLVVQGYSDTEKNMVLTQSPTIQRASQRVILALAPTLLLQGMRLWLRDITQAYTQSETPLQRRILAHLPEQIRHLYPDETIMVVIKPLYGIAEAGAHWWATYFRHHCERLHMETSTYDPCLLVTIADVNYFGIVGMQTDDTLGLSDTAFATKESEELKKAKFTAKEKQFLNINQPLLFNGCILNANNDGTLSIRQKNQGEKLRLVTDDESYVQQRARGAYIATICQPEASFDLSAAAQHKKPSKEEIASLNKRIHWQINSIGRGLTYMPLNFESMKLFVFVDASFANNKDLSSQIGYIIVLANEKESDSSFTMTGNIVHWSSTKCKRVTRSVLASEIYAMANGVDMAIAIGTTINSVVARLGVLAVPLVVCTDSLSLYECIVKLGTTREKRLMIDIMALRQAYERQEVFDIRWIDGRDNPADAMTKSVPNRALEALISNNTITMRIQGCVKRNRKEKGESGVYNEDKGQGENVGRS